MTISKSRRASIVREIRQTLSDGEITAAEVYGIIRTTMEAVEKLGPKVKGKDKKGVALAIVKDILKNEKSEVAKILRKNLSAGILGTVFDLVVDATHGVLSINDGPGDSTSVSCCF